MYVCVHQYLSLFTVFSAGMSPAVLANKKGVYIPFFAYLEKWVHKKETLTLSQWRKATCTVQHPGADPDEKFLSL